MSTMDSALIINGKEKSKNSPSSDASSYKPIPFGKEIARQFLFDPAWNNMNHGSFGTFPLPIRNLLREIQDQTEAHPDPFIRYTFPKLLDESRAAMANLLNATIETIVFVPNATTGVNTVLRNLVWNEDGKDEIIFFTTIYGACFQTICYGVEISHGLLSSREVHLNLPLSENAMCDLFKSAIQASRAAGKRPRVALFDTIASLPGYRMPFESFTKICRDEGILSLIDGAHGVGHIPINLGELDADFFVSNCHKWLYVPRGCAVFYVPLRNQPLLRSTLPTSHGFVARDPSVMAGRVNPLPASQKGEFVHNFEFVGTLDSGPYLCIPEALKWRREVCGGEAAIMEYCTKLARDGGKRVAQILGTNVLEDEEGKMTECCMINVRMPLRIGEKDGGGSGGGGDGKLENLVEPGYGGDATTWMHGVLMEEHKTFVAMVYFQDTWWARLSAQVYLDMVDFEWLGGVLKELCERAGKGEYLQGGRRKLWGLG